MKAFLLRAAGSLFLAAGLFNTGSATASVTVPAQALIPPAPTLPDVGSYVLMDFNSGQILAEKEDKAHFAPASLTKLMTAYLTYQAIAGHTLTLNQPVTVTPTAWRTGGSRMFIEPGIPVNVNQLLSGLIVDSGNDAAVALSQAVAGSRTSFVSLMNTAAQRLGLNDTHYTNVNGLPDPDLYSSARDVARLSRALVQNYPQVLAVSAQKYYTYNNIRQPTWNPVLFRDPTVDGLKTGLTDQSGYCIDATALRNGRRLIAVVLHGPSWKGSTSAVETLLAYGTQFFSEHRYYGPRASVATLHQANLTPPDVPVGPGRVITVALPKGQGGLVRAHWVLDQTPYPSLKAGQVVGQLVFTVQGKVVRSVPLLALGDAGPAGALASLWHRLRFAL